MDGRSGGVDIRDHHVDRVVGIPGQSRAVAAHRRHAADGRAKGEGWVKPVRHMIERRAAVGDAGVGKIVERGVVDPPLFPEAGREPRLAEQEVEQGAGAGQQADGEQPGGACIGTAVGQQQHAQHDAELDRQQYARQQPMIHPASFPSRSSRTRHVRS